jgi:hypothetical protein
MWFMLFIKSLPRYIFIFQAFKLSCVPRTTPVFRPSRDLLENMSPFFFREKYLVINDTVSRLWYNHNHPAPLFLFLTFHQ